MEPTDPSEAQATRPSRRLARGAPAALLVCAAACAVLLVGCSSPKTVSSADAAQQISDVLEDETGQRPDDVTCPEDLDAEVGATMRCELTDGEATYGVTIDVTEVEDGVATFDIQVDSEPQ